MGASEVQGTTNPAKYLLGDADGESDSILGATGDFDRLYVRRVFGVLLNSTNTGTPMSALSFPTSVTANAVGVAALILHGIDPGIQRGFIDGQVYRLDYRIHGERQGNLCEFLSVLVWNEFTPETPPTRLGRMKSVLTQYPVFYPIARYRPISRDLSRAKRDSMIAWLTNEGVDGKPLFALPIREEICRCRQRQSVVSALCGVELPMVISLSSILVPSWLTPREESVSCSSYQPRLAVRTDRPFSLIRNQFPRSE